MAINLLDPGDPYSGSDNPLVRPPPSLDSYVPGSAQANALGQGVSTSGSALWDWLQTQRQKSTDLGLLDPKTGLPTYAGIADAGKQYANALLAGTIAPRLSGGLPLEFKLDPTAPGFADRVSTRTPSTVQVPDLHSSQDYLTGADSFNASVGGTKVPYQTRTADIIAQQPGFERFANGNYGDPSEVHEAYVQHLTDNLLRMHDEVAATPWGNAAAGWYDGANTLATNTAAPYGLAPRQGAAMLARLSPGTPWDMNVAQYQRTMDIAANQGDSPMTDAMRDLYESKYASPTLENGKKNPDYKPKWATTIQAIDATKDGAPVTLNDLHGENAGLFVRLYDEAHNPDYLTYQQVNPDGTLGKTMSDSYTPNSNTNIGDAIGIMRDGRIENISDTLGDGHKIRHFYNNIISPNAGSDVTIDTHAMAAANLMPWGASRPEVAYGFGNSPQAPLPPHPAGPDATWLTGAKGGAATGSDGLYPLYAEAYRRAADQLDILPRQLQSMTWEGIKGLYEPAARRGNRGAAILNENSDLWRAYENGDASLADTQSAILRRGIQAPDWSRGGGTAAPSSP